jgi:hypothetical protein
MLDCFSRLRLNYQCREDVKRPEQQQLLPNYTFRKADGTWLPLVQVGVPMALVLLPKGFLSGQTHFADWLRKKSREVRGQQTRFIVVVHAEDLYTVVALIGDLLIVADENGQAMLELGEEESPIVCEVGQGRQIVRLLEQPELAA